MRIAFIHLSDFHLMGYEDALEMRADKAIHAVRSTVPGDDVYPALVITGDFAYSGEESQFRPMIAFIHRLKEDVSKEFGRDAALAIVPGNHDTPLEYDNVKELDDYRNAWKDQVAELYQSGLKKMDDFFGFAADLGVEYERSSGTFVSCLTFDNEHGTEQVRFVCLSSAPLSSKGNEQGRHYLPLEALEALSDECVVGKRVPYTAVLVHHPEYWFDDATKVRLESALSLSADFLWLFGGFGSVGKVGVTAAS